MTHIPVLTREVVEHLVWTPDGTYIDGTVGTGGHSLAVAERLSEKGRLICLDRDPDAVAYSKERLSRLGDRTVVVNANYADIDKVLWDLGYKEVSGVLLDLGMSSYQLERSCRGFSFLRDEPLDMRMDRVGRMTARHLINTLSLKDLSDIFKRYGEEKKARIIAKAIIKARKRAPIETSLELGSIVKSAVPPDYRSRAVHPATRVFQALRIAVNRELENLEVFLGKIPPLVGSGGRLVILSYHSLEDRLVKEAMSDWEKPCTCPPDLPRCVCGRVPVFKKILKKGLIPGPEEVLRNPRARSARLRAAERV
ncbi:MAG: 16S rRNA (cytosine(1402)-N(4))-methyltransferase RsmH [Desulfatiglans sp.]|jgi:16S rRNA (cytosine1402-N4)-methyltransferase|nr:16S rRNA (cytosine(1402)-N(4))-methyltransferase RsmH [Thermodesulfobacteriota bacterium]MEE4351303.1 16S rRNA (cytosine(1402)-N(4))-methyltransferase RsmH [Desulfatiglans sp.]